MSRNAEDIWKNAVPLCVAWEELAIPEVYKKYKELCENAKYKFSTADINRSRNEIEDEENYLKSGLLTRIQNGYLDAYGRYITQTGHTEICRIPNSLFNEQAKGFDPEWPINRIFVRDIKIIDVRVVPAEPLQNVPSTDEPADKKPAHRPNINDRVIPAINKLAKENPKFWELPQPKQCNLVRVALFGSNANPPKGFGDGAIKKRLRDLKPS